MTHHPVTSSTSILYCLGRPRVLGRQQTAGGLEGHGAQLPEKPSPGGLWGRQGPGSDPVGVGSLSVTHGVITFGVGEEPLALCSPVERTLETPPWPATVLAF